MVLYMIGGIKREERGVRNERGARVVHFWGALMLGVENLTQRREGAKGAKKQGISTR